MNQIVGFGMIVVVALFIIIIMHVSRGNPGPPEF
jgi:hypothetical protein